MDITADAPAVRPPLWWARLGAGVAVVAVVFVLVLPGIAPYDQVWAQIRRLEPAAVAPLAVVGAANLLAPSMSQRAALPGLRLVDAARTDWTTSAITNLLPGGSALSIGVTWSMYRSFGLAGTAIARAIVVTGAWDAFIKLGTPLLAVGWLATQRPVGPGLVQAAALGAALFVVAAGLLTVVLSGPGTATAVGRALDRLPLIGTGWVERLNALREDTLSLLADRWRLVTLWGIAGHANLYLLLVLCVRAVGVDRQVLGLAPILAAFAFGRLVTALPLTPGGLGIMELGLVGALGAVSDAGEASLVAAVLLFRFLTYAVPIPLGGLSWLWWTTRRP